MFCKNKYKQTSIHEQTIMSTEMLEDFHTEMNSTPKRENQFWSKTQASTSNLACS